MRGEAGFNPDLVPELNKDSEGIWLHNFIWGQINSGGMYDLWWWGSQNIEDNPQKGRIGNLYSVFLPYANFMADVPLNNGAYRDANAVTSDPRMRAWGQRDDEHGRIHLWIQNQAHEWKAAVDDEKIEPVTGTVRLVNVPGGTYHVEWWDPYRAANPIFKTETIQVEKVLELKLPSSLVSDVAVKIVRVK